MIILFLESFVEQICKNIDITVSIISKYFFMLNWTCNVSMRERVERFEICPARHQRINFYRGADQPWSIFFFFLFREKFRRSVPSERHGWKRNDRVGSEMESIKLTEGIAERWCVTVLTVIAAGINAWRRMRGGDVGRGRPPVAAHGGRIRGLWSISPEIKGLPTERNKVSQSCWRPACSNVIGCGSARVRYSSHTDPMPDFFHAFSHTLRFSVFGGRVSGYRQLEKESDTGMRERRRRVDFRNYETPLAPGDPSVDGGAHGAVRLRQCHFNYAC